MNPRAVVPGSLSNLSISLLLSLLKLLQASNTSAWISLKSEAKNELSVNNTDVDNISLSYPGHELSSSARNPSGIPNLYQFLWM